MHSNVRYNRKHLDIQMTKHNGLYFIISQNLLWKKWKWSSFCCKDGKKIYFFLKHLIIIYNKLEHPLVCLCRHGKQIMFTLIEGSNTCDSCQNEWISANYETWTHFHFAGVKSLLLNVLSVHFSFFSEYKVKLCIG